MRRRYSRGIVALGAALALLAACTDEIPTLSEAGELAPGTLPITLEHIFSSAEVLIGSFTVRGETSIEDATYLLAANQFGGELQSHVLARFRAFPDTLEIGTANDSVGQFLESQVVAVVADTLQVSQPVIEYQLWTITQPWDSLAVSWEFAVDRDPGRVRWATPGGARGQLLGTELWERSGETADADSLKWTISPEIVRKLATGEIPGLMVTLAQRNTLAQISPLSVRLSIEPKARNDTVVTRVVGPGPQQFIFTPQPSQRMDVLRVGGLTSDRSYARLDLTNSLPICPPPGAPSCQARALPKDVSLNRVELVLDPVPVPGGYRPVARYGITVRRVFEPELGPRAPLGPIIAVDTVEVAQTTGASSAPVRVNLTNAVLSVLNAEPALNELAVALLVEPQGSRFPYVWFAPDPRLRFIYTLPQQPQLP